MSGMSRSRRTRLTVDADEAEVDADEASDGEDDGPGPEDDGTAAPGLTDVADLELEGEIAADYIEGLLDVADLDGDIDMDVEGDRAVVSVVGATLDELVGSRGEVLEALQELTRLAVHRQTGMPYEDHDRCRRLPAAPAGRARRDRPGRRRRGQAHRRAEEAMGR